LAVWQITYWKVTCAKIPFRKLIPNGLFAFIFYFLNLKIESVGQLPEVATSGA